MIVSTRDDLPIAAAVCRANQQDASVVAQTLSSAVVQLPVSLDRLTDPTDLGPRNKRGKFTDAQRRRAKALLQDESRLDRRALPYLRADGNFAKDPSRLAAKQAGWRLWAPDAGMKQSRRGLGVIRSSVERSHALLNQCGRIYRRLDRTSRRYLAWIELACCLIFMRRGFFP